MVVTQIHCVFFTHLVDARPKLFVSCKEGVCLFACLSETDVISNEKISAFKEGKKTQAFVFLIQTLVNQCSAFQSQKNPLWCSMISVHHIGEV